MIPFFGKTKKIGKRFLIFFLKKSVVLNQSLFMKKVILILILLLQANAFGQKIILSKLSQIAFAADIFLGYDKFGYYYGITDNVFFKGKDGQSIEYKNLSLGKIKSVDLQNPLKIILFYEDFNTIVTLDNQLNEIQKISFSDNPTPIVVGATAMASQNRFWIYNSLTQQIGLYDYLKNNYVPITQSLQGNLKYYEADFNYFQWIDEKGQGYVCDVFGKISSLGTFPDFDEMHFVKDKILFLHDFKNNKTRAIEIADKTFKSFFYKEQILSIFTTEGITNYKITIP